MSGRPSVRPVAIYVFAPTPFFAMFFVLFNLTASSFSPLKASLAAPYPCATAYIRKVVLALLFYFLPRLLLPASSLLPHRHIYCAPGGSKPRPAGKISPIIRLARAAQKLQRPRDGKRCRNGPAVRRLAAFSGVYQRCTSDGVYAGRYSCIRTTLQGRHAP